MRQQDSSPLRRRSREAIAASHPAVPGSRAIAAPRGQRLPASAVPATIRRQSAGLAGAHDVSPRPSDAGAQSRPASERVEHPRPGGALVAIDPDRRCSRSSAAPTFHSTFGPRGAQRSGSPAARSSRPLRHGARSRARQRVGDPESAGRVGAGNPEWMPRNSDARARRSPCARRSAGQQRCGRGAAESGGIDRPSAAASDAGLDRLPDVPCSRSAPIVTPIDLTGIRCFRRWQWRVRGASSASTTRRIAGVRSRRGPRTRDQRGVVVPDGVAAARRVIERGTGAPARALGVRGGPWAKNRDDRRLRDAWSVGFSSSVVVGVWAGSISRRRSAAGMRRARALLTGPNS